MLCIDKRSMVQAQYCSEWTELWYGTLQGPILCSEMTEPDLQVYHLIYYWLTSNNCKSDTSGSDLTGGNWQKWKRVFLTCPCHEIYRDEAVGLKSCKNTWKITIFVKMWNLGQYHKNLIFVNNCLIKAWI